MAGNGNPFGKNAEIGVGFSDAALLAASVTGFVMLATTVYSIIVMRLKSSKEVEKDAVAGGDAYAEQLTHADVSTLNRAQRRARARAIMKQQRRAAIQEDPSEHEVEVEFVVESDAEVEDDGEAEKPSNNRNTNTLSRKERQRIAKATEREERHLLEKERREHQKQLEEEAQKKKREKEKEDARKHEEALLLEKAQTELEEISALEAWYTFLSSPKRSQSVQEWIDEMKDRRTVLTKEIATSFALPVEKVVERLEELVKEGRVPGVMEGGGRFVYISDKELQSIADTMIERGSVSLTDIAAICNQEIGSVQG
jgi:hypothetical protein